MNVREFKRLLRNMSSTVVIRNIKISFNQFFFDSRYVTAVGNIMNHLNKMNGNDEVIFLNASGLEYKLIGFSERHNNYYATADFEPVPAVPAQPEESKVEHKADLATVKFIRDAIDEAARFSHGGYPDKSLLKIVDRLDHFITAKNVPDTSEKKPRLVMHDLLKIDYSDSARIYDVKDIQHVIDGPTFFVSGGRTDFVSIAEVRDMYNKYKDIHFTTELSLLADGVYHSIERIQLLGTDMRQEEYALVFSDSK